MPEKISIIIPNWNGKAFLNRCIAAILHSATEYGKPYECLLMDDASTDGSADEAARLFPDVHVIKHQQNLGFGNMVNKAGRIASGEILILINNDLIARPPFLERLCRHFTSDSKLFGVSGKTVDWDKGSPNHLNMRGRLCRGRLQLTWSDDDALTSTMFVQGGSCAIRRDIFLQLNGFYPLFAPGYWEDYDLSYQALKAGYVNLYEPEAVGSHLGQGSMIRAHGRERIDFVKERNRMLMLALNLSGKAHQEFWEEMPNYIRSGYGARFKYRLNTLNFLLLHAAEIKAERKRRSATHVLSDEEVFWPSMHLGNPC